MNPGSPRWTLVPAMLLCLFLAAACSQAPQGQVVFDTPEAAVDEVVTLLELRDDERIEAVFGPGSVDMFRSGDDEADREDVQRIAEMIEVRVAFEEYDENTVIALFGESEWPWPIPLVREEAGWRFDTTDGREELLNRRIGRNELWTLTALHEIVDAQREYHHLVPEGHVSAYAARFLSTEGRRDGLYWPTQEDEAPSPLGGLLAESDVRHATEPQPFHGYFYRMLLKQGPNAPGGEREYAGEDGRLTGGFAVIAWPAKYGNSGVMTFITDRRGLVYQKDLGDDTEAMVDAIDSYNPDDTWAPTPDSLEEVQFSDWRGPS